MKKIILALVMVVGLISVACALQTAPSLGANGMELRGTIIYGLKDYAPINFNGEFVYGVVDQADVRAILGYHSLKGGGSGKLSYGLGAKWAFLAEAESMPALAVDVSYVISKDGDVDTSWLPIDLIISKNLGGWDLLGTVGYRIPKSGDGWIGLSIGVSYPLMDKLNLLGAVAYDLVKDANYASIEAGINYKL
jgi:opacity protein-like surface antigen